MYISKIELINIRCYDHLTLNLRNNGDIVKWVTILGDNGTGKSTLLKSIALGLCDKTSAAGLLREIPWKLINDRKKVDSGTIKIHLDKKGTKYEISTIIRPLYGKDKRIETIDRFILNKTTKKEVGDEEFNWDDIFVCGYGASRNAEGTADYLNYSIVDAVYTLFRYDQPLQNPELAMRRYLQRSKKNNDVPESDTLDWLNKLLDPILLLDEGEKITLEDDGIWVDSNKWGKTPLASTGDGYKATLTWLMDFISWASYFYKGSIKKSIRGIILIDEIEQHLHPNWQRNIVDILRKTFPNVQFISTTHSPLVTINSVELGDEKSSNLYILKWISKGNVDVSEVRSEIADLGFDQILGSEAFGYIYENPRIEVLLKELSQLVGLENANKTQKKRIEEIIIKLKEYQFISATSPVEREIIKNYKKNLIGENIKLREMLK